MPKVFRGVAVETPCCVSSTPHTDTNEEVLHVKHVAGFIVHLSAGIKDRSMKLISVIAPQRILHIELVSAQLEEYA